MGISNGVDQLRTDVLALYRFVVRIFERTKLLGKRTQLVAVALFVIPLIIAFSWFIEFACIVIYIILVDAVLAVAASKRAAVTGTAQPIEADWRRV